MLEVARRIDRGEVIEGADYFLSFPSASQLFRELSPARLALLEHLKATGPQSVYGLARSLGRNYSNVYRDVHKLMDHDLVVKSERGQVLVPWEEISIRLALGAVAAPGPERHASSQFSTLSPGTRENSPTLLVTTVRLKARAWAAISMSFGPMGVPCRSSRLRRSA